MSEKREREERENKIKLKRGQVLFLWKLKKDAQSPQLIIVSKLTELFFQELL